MDTAHTIAQVRDAVLRLEPHPIMIYAARYCLVVFRDDIPDWIVALAFGNPDEIVDLIDEVRRFVAAEEAG